MSSEGPNKETFQTSSGVKQRGNESPSLFNLFLNSALHIYKHRCAEMGTDHVTIPYCIPKESINKRQWSWPMYCWWGEHYADDIGIRIWNKNDYKQNLLYQVFQEMRLKINLSKTNTMIWNWNDSSDRTYIESYLL